MCGQKNVFHQFITLLQSYVLPVHLMIFCCKFKWANPDGFKESIILNMKDDSDLKYIIDVDLVYSKK